MRVRDQTLLILALGVCGGLICFYPLLLQTPLLDPDEGLHASIAQEMAERGDWVVPSLRGEPFRDKPILFFWTQALSLKLFGMSEASARFPGLMFGLLSALTTGLLARQLFDRTLGVMAALISMTLIVPAALAQAAAHDVALVPWTNLALLFLWKADEPSSLRRRIRFLPAIGCFLGLAILTKGLIGVAVILVGFGTYQLVTRRLSAATVLFCGLAILLGLLIASPWFIAMEQRRPGYLSYYFIERHLMGFATSTQRHGNESWYYYVPFIAVGAMPWIAFLLPVFLQRLINRRKGIEVPRVLLFLVAWFAGGLLFLTLAKSKLVTYALPMFPAIAILSAVAWRDFATYRMAPLPRKVFSYLYRAGAFLGLVIPPIMLLVMRNRLDVPFPAAAVFAVLAVSLTSAFAWVQFEKRRHIASMACGSIWIALLFGTIMTWPLQTLAERHSARSLARWVSEQPEMPEQIVFLDRLPASTYFYLEPQVRESLAPERIVRIFTPQLPDMDDLPPGTILAISDTVLARTRQPFVKIPGRERAVVGQFHIFECEDEMTSSVRVAGRN